MPIIREVRVILTQPDAIRLVVVKVETDQPGLYGVGCATFTQRASAVGAAIEDGLRPLLIGRHVRDIEDLWQASYVSSYWRAGPVLNNAISGVDEALWDIKGKLAGMPVCDLIGGRARDAAAVYTHAAGRDVREVEDQVRALQERGFHHIRAQMSVPGYSTYGAGETGEQVVRSPRIASERARAQREGSAGVFEPRPYARAAVHLFEHLRSSVGWDVELLHDIHERLPPIDAVGLAKELERFRLFFLEDPFAPEDASWFRMLRAQSATPIAMGELFVNQAEMLPLIKDNLIDFIRVHVSDIGGITPARKLAATCEAFGVRTAWHGPSDVSPVGHAANLMLDLACWNFGVQEYTEFPQRTREVFPGCPEVRDGYMWPNERPGLGIDVHEGLAAKYPYRESPDYVAWTQVRRADGSIARP